MQLFETKEALIEFVRSRYESSAPGSATAPGTLYHELPFEGYDALPVQRQGCADRLAALTRHIDFAGKHVLDIGCNAGYFCLALAQRGGRCWGVDHDADALTIANSLRKIHDVSGATFVCGRFDQPLVDRLKSEMGHADVILLNSVMHWLIQATGSIRVVQRWLNQIPSRGRQYIVYEPSSSLRAYCPEQLRESRVRRFFHGLGVDRIERIAQLYATNDGTMRDYWLGVKDVDREVAELDSLLGERLSIRRLQGTGARLRHRKREKIAVGHRRLFVKTVDRRGSAFNMFLKNEGATVRVLTQAGQPVPLLIAEKEFSGRTYLIYEDARAPHLAATYIGRRDAVWIVKELRRMMAGLAECGVVHNDVRMQNVLLLRASQELCLIDFEFSERNPTGRSARPDPYRPFAPPTEEECRLLDELLAVLRDGGEGRGTGTFDGDRAAFLRMMRILSYRKLYWSALGRHLWPVVKYGSLKRLRRIKHRLTRRGDDTPAD